MLYVKGKDFGDCLMKGLDSVWDRMAADQRKDAQGQNSVTVEAPEKATAKGNAADLVAQINNDHKLAWQNHDEAIKHAIKCGELLLQQKKQLEHGEFMSWIQRHCEFEQSTATRYMKAAEAKILRRKRQFQP